MLILSAQIVYNVYAYADVCSLNINEDMYLNVYIHCMLLYLFNRAFA